MSKIKFTIGKSQSLVFNLPSKAPGDSETCMGKVLINSNGINCSKDVSFAKADLLELHRCALKIYQTLSGKVSISSKCNTFNLAISATNKGHIKIEASMSNIHFTTPENSEWLTKVCFYDYPESLVQLIESVDAIES